MIERSFASLGFYVEFQSMALKMFVNSWNHHTIPITFLLICSKILIKRNPTCLFVFERGCLFYVFAASMSLIMEFHTSHGKLAFQNLTQQELNVLSTSIQRS